MAAGAGQAHLLEAAPLECRNESHETVAGGILVHRVGFDQFRFFAPGELDGLGKQGAGESIAAGILDNMAFEPGRSEPFLDKDDVWLEGKARMSSAYYSVRVAGRRRSGRPSQVGYSFFSLRSLGALPFISLKTRLKWPTVLKPTW